jgi:hypothetical protein
MEDWRGFGGVSIFGAIMEKVHLIWCNSMNLTVRFFPQPEVGRRQVGDGPIRDGTYEGGSTG